MIAAGIDMGARSIKLVLLEKDDGAAAPRLLGQHSMFPAALDMDAAAERAYVELLQPLALTPRDVGCIVATGVARRQVPFADREITEVASGGRGAADLCVDVRTVIDVGAEEARAIRLDEAGRVADFAGNEKCAAGAGAFAESMARALQLTLSEFGAASLRSTQSIPMNAQCTVFAESEVVSLIHAATPVDDIARAVLDAVASRICAMARRVGIRQEVLLIGGMAHNPGFVQALERALEVPSIRLPQQSQSQPQLQLEPEYVCALGAALSAFDEV
ncbi:Benzoyl CoA reductase subunit [Sterolibacterium denitrificans]|uniref:Benzoyl CoA reductase subunit n=1 Tax=Sterolibacterium denitrificans TaxID=157592 RepID=A0A7Z7HSA9_9PROT|nr:acyl-CoA dehydratase activase [Sterolibacterium denitrificans]SMB27495.1 Benzoyl CoA reductase subunit [Sterolibacterium denitrificans]